MDQRLKLENKRKRYRILNTMNERNLLIKATPDVENYREHENTEATVKAFISDVLEIRCHKVLRRLHA